jgi:ferredoxin
MARGGTHQTVVAVESRQWHDVAAVNREKAALREKHLAGEVLAAVRRGEHGQTLARSLGISTRRINEICSRSVAMLPKAPAATRRLMRYAQGECNRHGTTLLRLQASGAWRCAACLAVTHSAKHRRRAQAVRARGGDTAEMSRDKARTRKLLLLDGRPCARCGYNAHPSALQFHHRDPATKVADVSRIRDLELALAEVAKCDVYCATCHEEIEVQKSSLELPAARGSEGLTVDCDVHGENSPALAPSRKRPTPRCALCKALSLRELRRRKKRLLVEGMGSKCVCCGYTGVMTLQFHHLDPATKRFTISRAIRSGTVSWEELCAEAAACALVCPNCHVEVEQGERKLPRRLPNARFASLR